MLTVMHLHECFVVQECRTSQGVQICSYKSQLSQPVEWLVDAATTTHRSNSYAKSLALVDG